MANCDNPPKNRLRLPGPYDPLTLREQEALILRLGCLRPGHVLIACEVENIRRMAATLRYYHAWLSSAAAADAALPKRVRSNGVDYLEE